MNEMHAATVLIAAANIVTTVVGFLFVLLELSGIRKEMDSLARRRRRKKGTDDAV